MNLIRIQIKRIIYQHNQMTICHPFFLNKDTQAHIYTQKQAGSLNTLDPNVRYDNDDDDDGD